MSEYYVWLTTTNMIDYVMTIHKNYDLLYLQLENFKKRMASTEYRLIFVDNTPGEKQPIKIEDESVNHLILTVDAPDQFDGASHGYAINCGMQHCTSPIVCVIDSDFFILNNKMHEYVRDIFSQGYRAVGCEMDDGDGTKVFLKAWPHLFENIPYLFCAYYDIHIAKAASWGITDAEAKEGTHTGFLDTGWRIRKYILDNKIKTCNWKTDATSYGNCYFRNSKLEMMGLHYGAGSHRRWNEDSKTEISAVIQKDFGQL